MRLKQPEISAFRLTFRLFFDVPRADGMIIEEVLTWMKKYKARRWSTYAEYYELLDQATQARDAYLTGRLSEEDALPAIRKS